jgi:hypothetical protein
MRQYLPQLVPSLQSAVNHGLLLAALFVSSAGSALGEDGISVGKTRFESALRYLASDELEGRGVGTAGIAKAADFLLKEYLELGLHAEKQSFEVVTNAELGPPESNQLVFHGPPGDDGTPRKLDVELSKDFSPLAIGGTGVLDTELVFAGYGITAKDEQFDEYASVDVTGKVVVLIRKEPQQDEEDSVFSGKQSSRYAYFSTKVANAYEHGAAAVILVNDAYGVTQSRETARKRWLESLEKLAELRDSFPAENADAEAREKYREEADRVLEQLQSLNERLAGDFDDVLPLEGAGTESSHKNLPVVFARRAVIDEIVQSVGGKDLATIEREIDDELVPQSFSLEGWKAVGQIRVDHRKAMVDNVVAVLEGSGSLADETIVIGAHYDHLGMGGAGSLAPWTKAIHNGADDNASGTVALLAVAQHFATADKKPARRLVFIAFAGEERGLLGSAHYVKNPCFPLEKTVAMLNMDMVGRLTDNKLIVHGTGTATEFDGMINQLNEEHSFEITKEPGGFGPSDHASFYGKEIPVLHFFTGTHRDYHRPSDDVEKINFDGILRVTEFVTDAVSNVDAMAKAPEYQQIRRRQMNRGGSRPYFGSIPDFGIQVEGYALMGVTKDSPAQRAGMTAGDVIVQFGDSRIGGLEGFDSALRKFKAGDKVPVTVLRDEQRVTVTVTLDPPR